MRSAPAVQFRTGPDAVWRCGAASCCAAAAAGVSAWLSSWFRIDPTLVGGTAVLCGGAAAAAAERWLAAPSGVLVWDGSQWTWDGEAGWVEAVVDLGPWLLLCFCPLAGRRRGRIWLPVSRRRAGPCWHGLRTAVYSRRPEPRTPSALRM